MPHIVIAYVPALHKGYIDFFAKHKGTLYILDFSLVREQPRLDRDIRAIEPAVMKGMIESLGLFTSVSILNKNALSSIPKDAAIVMPDEDVSRQFVEAYLQGRTVTYEQVFLRWDKTISTKEFEVPADRVISTDEFDRKVMKGAFAEADKSSDWWRQIGAIAVKDGEILLAAHNRPLPSDQVHNIVGDPRSNFDAGVSIELSKFLHAEAGLIAEAAKRGLSLDGASLYVTTFPCPVCAKSVAASGFKHVFYSKGYSLLDAEDVLKTHGIKITCVTMP